LPDGVSSLDEQHDTDLRGCEERWTAEEEWAPEVVGIGEGSALDIWRWKLMQNLIQNHRRVIAGLVVVILVATAIVLLIAYSGGGTGGGGPY
jgi:hypothetical protein